MIEHHETDYYLRAQENRLRRMAKRQGLHLRKHRGRDPHAWDFGTYMLVDNRTNVMVTPGPGGQAFGLSLDEIEAFLTA